jgi:hypothetical protein
LSPRNFRQRLQATGPQRRRRLGIFGRRPAGDSRHRLPHQAGARCVHRRRAAGGSATPPSRSRPPGIGRLVIIDLLPVWFDWTEQVISISDLAVVTCLNHVPGLRFFEILQGLKGGERAPSRIVVALNRCEAGLGGRVACEPRAGGSDRRLCSPRHRGRKSRPQYRSSDLRHQPAEQDCQGYPCPGVAGVQFDAAPDAQRKIAPPANRGKGLSACQRARKREASGAKQLGSTTWRLPRPLAPSAWVSAWDDILAHDL